MEYKFNVGDRVYYKHEDPNDKSDTGTILEIHHIPEEGHGIIRIEDVEVIVLFDKAYKKDDDNLIQTSQANLEKL